MTQSKKISAPELEKSALKYIGKYATSIENLRKVLIRRIERSKNYKEIAPEEAKQWIDIIIKKFTDANLLNDSVFAINRAKNLHRSGASRKKIIIVLKNKGINKLEINLALNTLDSEFKNTELEAALNYVRRKRLGPYRPNDERKALRKKDLAKLAREGFLYSDAIKVIDIESLEEVKKLV